LWDDLVLPEAGPDSPTFRVVAIHDPRHGEPLLLASPLAVSPRALRDLYVDRWPVEQLPLAAKQMVGAERQFVFEPETCQRRPGSGTGAPSRHLAACCGSPEPVARGHQGGLRLPETRELKKPLNALYLDLAVPGFLCSKRSVMNSVTCSRVMAATDKGMPLVARKLPKPFRAASYVLMVPGGPVRS